MPRPLLLALILLAGCRPAPPGGTVYGRVTVGGAPATAGSVLLQAENPRWATVGIIAPDGTFTVSDIPPGPVRVGVRTHGVRRFDAAGAEPVLAPRRYEDPAHSGLLFEVAAGEQEWDVALPAE